MNQDELNRFLATVRKTRFVDYLDPIGETAIQAFERRIRWAQRSLDDPANVDEANFLLDYEYELRELVKEEMAQEDDEDWVVGVDAGQEAGPQSWKPNAATKRTNLDEDFAPDEPPPAKRLNTGVPVARSNSHDPDSPAHSSSDLVMPAAFRRATAPTEEEEDAADVPFKRGAAPSIPSRSAATTKTAPAKAAPGGKAAPAAKSAPAAARPAPKSAPVMKGRSGMLPEEPEGEDDPWDVEQTGIMRMEDLTPTPLHARASAPKGAPKAAAPPEKLVPPERSTPKPILTSSGPETVDAASGWDDDDEDDGDLETRVDVTSAAMRGRATPAPIQRSPTPPPYEPEPSFGSEPEPEPVADPVSANRARDTGPALLSRSALVHDKPVESTGGRSKLPLVLGFVGLLAAAGAAAVIVPPMLQKGSGTDVVEAPKEPVAEAVVQADPPEPPPEPELEVLDLTGGATEDPPPSVLDLTQDAPATGSVTSAADPKASTGGTKTGTTTGGTKAPDPKGTSGDTKTAGTGTTSGTGGTKTTSGTGSQTASSGTTSTKGSGDTKTASNGDGSKTDAQTPKTEGTAKTGTTTTKTDGGAAATSTSTSGEGGGTSAPAAGTSLKGLWTGKIDGKALYLTIVRVDGTAVTASAEFQRDEGFLKWDLRGTYDETTGAISLSDAAGGGTLRGNIKENKFAGSADVGGAQVSWSAAKR